MNFVNSTKKKEEERKKKVGYKVASNERRLKIIYHQNLCLKSNDVFFQNIIS